MHALSGTSVAVFVCLTVVIIGGAGVLTGHALAQRWRPVWQVVFASLGLGVADRFLVYALFDGPLLSPIGYVFDVAVIMTMALISYRIAHVTETVRQYPWLYERHGLWRFRARG